MVDKWCVIIKFVFFFINIWNVFWIRILVWVFIDDVVLFNINILGNLRKIWVIVNSWYCFCDNEFLVFFKYVLYLFGNCLIKKFVLVVFVVFIILLWLVLGLVYVMLLWIVVFFNYVFCNIILIFCFNCDGL